MKATTVAAVLASLPLSVLDKIPREDADRPWPHPAFDDAALATIKSWGISTLGALAALPSSVRLTYFLLDGHFGNHCATAMVAAKSAVKAPKGISPKTCSRADCVAVA